MGYSNDKEYPRGIMILQKLAAGMLVLKNGLKRGENVGAKLHAGVSLCDQHNLLECPFGGVCFEEDVERQDP